MSFDNVTGIIPPILGLAVAGYAVKTIGDMMHAKCTHCGKTMKHRDHRILKERMHQHSKTHQSGNMFFWELSS